MARRLVSAWQMTCALLISVATSVGIVAGVLLVILIGVPSTITSLTVVLCLLSIAAAIAMGVLVFRSFISSAIAGRLIDILGPAVCSCEKCRYLLDGLPIVEGQVTCPECHTTQVPSIYRGLDRCDQCKYFLKGLWKPGQALTCPECGRLHSNMLTRREVLSRIALECGVPLDQPDRKV